MKQGIIITEPRHDMAMEYLSQFTTFIKKVAEKRNIPIKILLDKNANKKEFTKVVKKLNYKMNIFNGHGSQNFIGGYLDEPIIDIGNKEILKDRITYARVCESAATLGKKIEENQGCFIGYELPFMFYSDERYSSTPVKDKIVKLFLDPSNAVPISLIKGNDAEEANKRSKKMILKNINKIMHSKSDESLLIAEALWNNYIGQVVLGNSKATL